MRDGFSPQTNIVRQNGERGVLVSIIKNGGVIDPRYRQRAAARNCRSCSRALPKDLKITPLFDQSGFVRAAISGVVREALIAAALTAALILLFLGNWRSTCIIAVSIPLSILTSIIALYAIGETLNIMTLGGLALAVGILVDDATVTIENIERHMHLGSDLHKAILDGAGEIAVPALVSTLCICIVFVPMFFLSGVARYLFAPLAEAVVFAMLASYVLSRTLVPTLVMLMMDHAPAAIRRPAQPAAEGVPRLRCALREDSRRLLASFWRRCSSRRRLFAGLFLGFCVLSCGLVFILGRDFFPAVDGGQIRLHMRLPTGTRIEETARVADQVEAAIRSIGAGARSRARCSTTWACRTAASTCLTAMPEPSARWTARFRSRSMQGHRPTAGLRRADAPRTAAAVSGRGVLLPAGRHDDPDPELRTAGGHRRADHRRRSARQLS